MRLSESLRKNIMDVSVGRILNKFKVRSRRSVLFPEDILANYVKECESKGHGKDIKEICKRHAYIGTSEITPSLFKKLPITLFLNKIAKRVWTNIGVLDDLYATKRGNIIYIKTKNEFISRIIGENDFSTGFIEGVISVLTNHDTHCIKKFQTKKQCKYSLYLRENPYPIAKTKGKEIYNHMNISSRTKGFELREAIKKRVFIIRNNRVCFRGKVLVPVEVTLFHLLSNSKMLFNRISNIAYNTFESIIEKDVSIESKLKIIKNFLQATGWGIVNTILTRNKIIISINDPPYGLQVERDNWDFLVRVILGFLWTVNRNYSIKAVRISGRLVKIEYSL